MRSVNTVLNYLIAQSSGNPRRTLDPENRDINEDCGYPDRIGIQDYKDYYEREGVATRVVNIKPSESWASYPDLRERVDQDQNFTPFENRWNELLTRPFCHPWHYLERVDELSGIGSYGILVLGVNDNRDFEAPVAGLNDLGLPSRGRPRNQKENDLSYIRAFDQSVVRISSLDTDQNSPRFGQPLYYQIQWADPSDVSGNDSPSPTNLRWNTIHWTRVLHIAEQLGSSEIHAMPRMQPVFNRLVDVRKVAGGSAEMFWKGAFPGYAFEVFPELAEMIDVDKDAIQEEMYLYMNRLQRFLTGQGGKWRSLAPQVADPSKHLEWLIRLICTTIGVPIRIFTGSESGHLASTQDKENWNRRMGRRQRNYISPRMIRPFVDRLILLGIAPPPKQYKDYWEDLNAMTDEEKADVGLKTTQALLQYVTSGAEKIMPLPEFLTTVLGYNVDEAAGIVTKAKKSQKTKDYFTKELWKSQAAAQQPGGSNTNPIPKRGGGPRNALGKGRPAGANQ